MFITQVEISHNIAYVQNKSYNPRMRKKSFELWTGTKSNINNIPIFGTIFYAYVQNKKKIDNICEKTIFVTTKLGILCLERKEI